MHAEDFCYIDSESPSSEGQYVDLMLNPERFTGYAGESAHKVWRAIYEENCFGLTEKVGIEYDADGSLDGGAGRGVTELKGGLGGQNSWTEPRKQQGFGTDMRRRAARDEECLEKRIYYRIISGKYRCFYSACTVADSFSFLSKAYMRRSAYISVMNTWIKPLENG